MTTQAQNCDPCPNCNCGRLNAAAKVTSKGVQVTTQAQIAAGIKILRGYDPERDISEDCVVEIFQAMTAAAEVEIRQADIDAAKEICAKADDTATRLLVKTTIERCAQVAAAFDSDCVDSREVTAAIRAIKNE